MTTTRSTADLLLDAQVTWVLDQLTGDRLDEVVARDVDELLAAAAHVPLGAVATPEDVVAVVELLLERVPSSAVTTTMTLATADQVHAGPLTPIVPGELVARERVGELVDAALALRPLVAQALDRLTDSPAVGALSSRFVTRLVVDVLEANRSMAKRIPGVGSIVSLGTNVATKAVGAADKQVQALLGDTPGKGTAMAVRRLNAVVMSTLEDPTLRDAVLEAWDAYADEPFDGIADVVDQRDVRRLADVLQDIVIAAAPTPPVLAFVTAWVDTVFALYGEDDVASVLVDLGISRDDVVTVSRALLPPLVAAAAADGRLEDAVRARLAPFFRSPAVAAVLAET